MKKNLLILLLFLVPFVVMSQKVTVKVIKTEKTALSQWQILDEEYNIAFSGDEYFRDDSVTFFLDANKRYFLKISVLEIYKRDTTLYSLLLGKEPILLINSDIEPGDHSYPFFTGVRQEVSKIVGGTTASITDFPWQVYYISGNFRCGGSIIANDWILTAAHCTRDDNGVPILASSMAVRVGSTVSTDGQLYNVSQVIVNSGFDSQTLVNDIALLKLAVPISNVNAKPIRIVNSDDVAFGAIDPGVMTWVTGWGLTRVSPQVVPASLQKVQLPIVSNAQAATVWGTIPSTDIMAGYLNGNKDACNGDSGGPMVVPVIDEYKLAGIVSWGSLNCDTYGAYTRVSQFEGWIRTNTGIAKEYSPPAPSGDTVICSGNISNAYTIGTVAGATVYEWQILPAKAGAISGSTADATVLWNTGFTGAALIAARVTINGVVSEWSRLALVVVPVTALLSQTADTTICEGQPITFNVGAVGHNLSYKWFKDGTLLQSGTSSKLFLLSSTTLNTGAYSCQVTGSCGTVTSRNINLTVYPLTNITSLSPDTQVAFGGDLSLTVGATGHDLNYQWQKDKTILDNTNTSNLFIQSVNAENTGLYRVTVTGTCGTRISDSIYVFIKKQNSSGDPEVFLWPSVTVNEFNVALSNDAVYNVNIYNSRGELVREQTNCRFKTIINISAEAQGAYIVNVFNNNFRRSLKLIKL